MHIECVGAVTQLLNQNSPFGLTYYTNFLRIACNAHCMTFNWTNNICHRCEMPKNVGRSNDDIDVTLNPISGEQRAGRLFSWRKRFTVWFRGQHTHLSRKIRVVYRVLEFINVPLQISFVSSMSSTTCSLLPGFILSELSAVVSKSS
jgi:hypothetical protein